ncbi:MAG: hypothetical protein EP344_10490 [Bacteroidetes bacterium]|nr:MAG: hypothetical protein EP344_10490 [Bacteroidota bacterium]
MARTFIEQICKRTGIPGLPDILARQLTGSELSSLLLEVFHQRSRQISPSDVLRTYQQNRFVQPSGVDALAFRRFEQQWLDAGQAAGFGPLELSPVSPLGTCSALGTVHQNKVLSALRGTEVTADATNLLALESASQRQALGYPYAPKKYCAAHRHLRTQQADVPGFTPHFSIFCLTTSGRDTGHFSFERESILQHLDFYLDVLGSTLQHPELKIVLRALDPDSGDNPMFDQVLAAVQNRLLSVPVKTERQPQSGQQYYHRLQFTIVLERDGREYPIGDGGFTDWTRSLTGNQKERFLSSGIGLEFLWKVRNGVV